MSKDQKTASAKKIKLGAKPIIYPIPIVLAGALEELDRRPADFSRARINALIN